MKKILSILLMFPALCFADRLGSLNSNANVALTTQTINNTSTFQPGSTFNVSSGTINYLRYKTILGVNFPSSRVLYTDSDSAATIGNLYYTGTNFSIGGSPTGSGRLQVYGDSELFGSVAASTITSTTDITLSPAGDVKVTGSTPIKFYDADNSNYIGLSAATNVPSNIDFKISADGTNGQVLTTDGSGNLSFTTVSGGGGSSAYLSKFVLIDSSGTPREVTVTSTGALVTTAVGSIPQGVIARQSIVLQDADFGFWTITVNTSGALVTASGGSPSATISDLLLNDSTNKTWVISVNTSGNLVTS